VALDRQSIEKKDFPVGRRGYDPEAVDAHLATLADEVSEYKQSARRRSDTLASSASEQVRAIVEAAENSAAGIQREAEEEAKEIRQEATTEAKAVREQATEQAREYVGKVSESTGGMMQRLDAMEKELTGLIESLRTGGNRLNADLQLLEDSLSEASAGVVPRPAFEPEPEPVAEPEPEPLVETTSAPWESDTAVVAEEVELEVTGEDVDGPAGAEALPEESDDAEGARLIALNMALNGTPREETARYLSENFQLSDAGGLLDEVYASVDG